jgi:hypothetical protein
MTEEQILEKLRNIECALSPENLAHDGERSVEAARQAGAKLRKERDRLVARLGREPTSEELYPRY